jgi:hypothetical protein
LETWKTTVVRLDTARLAGQLGRTLYLDGAEGRVLDVPGPIEALVAARLQLSRHRRALRPVRDAAVLHAHDAARDPEIVLVTGWFWRW